ncbi:MAG: NRDE family protein [Planctomycetota bacterium]|nr:NRDE family protein [Planctomycetota bacterium]
MCFVLLHHQTREDYPVVVLANRDEYFDRPFEGPAVRDETLGIVAPRDLRAGGTWLGINGHGMVAALTNRGHRVFSDVRSRGRLVDDVLRSGSADAAIDWIQQHLGATAYAGFNLLLADARQAWVVRHDGSDAPLRPASDDVIALEPGAHTLSNLHDVNEVPVPPLGVPPASHEPLPSTFEKLAALAADETTPLPGDHRILKRGTNRGTVCSALIALPPEGAGTAVFHFADGVPGERPFRPVR